MFPISVLPSVCTHFGALSLSPDRTVPILKTKCWQVYINRTIHAYSDLCN